MKILIIDDNKDNTFMLKLLIKMKLGADVEVAYDGKTGLEKIEEFKPEYVVLDITLPDMSGEEVAQIIKMQYPETIIIGISGYSEEDLAINRSYFAEFWTKPVSVDIIKEYFKARN